MKYFLVFIMVTILSSLSSAVEIRVEDMTPVEGMDRSFILKTSLSDKVILDCQSFIQGLNIGYESRFLLEPEECESLQDRIHSSIDQSQFHCLDVEDTVRSDYICN